jgi:hypothetical protein
MLVSESGVEAGKRKPTQTSGRGREGVAQWKLRVQLPKEKEINVEANRKLERLHDDWGPLNLCSSHSLHIMGSSGHQTLWKHCRGCRAASGFLTPPWMPD